MEPRYPTAQVEVCSGSPLALISAVRQALRRAGAEPAAVADFTAEAFALGEFPGVLRLCRDWVRVRPGSPPSALPRRPMA